MRLPQVPLVTARMPFPLDMILLLDKLFLSLFPLFLSLDTLNLISANYQTVAYSVVKEIQTGITYTFL
jgi:hypothetical protein